MIYRVLVAVAALAVGGLGAGLDRLVLATNPQLAVDSFALRSSLSAFASHTRDPWGEIWLWKEVNGVAGPYSTETWACDERPFRLVHPYSAGSNGRDNSGAGDDLSPREANFGVVCVAFGSWPTIIASVVVLSALPWLRGRGGSVAVEVAKIGAMSAPPAMLLLILISGLRNEDLAHLRVPEMWVGARVAVSMSCVLGSFLTAAVIRLAFTRRANDPSS